MHMRYSSSNDTAPYESRRYAQGPIYGGADPGSLGLPPLHPISIDMFFIHFISKGF